MKELLKGVLQFDTAKELRDYIKPYRQVELSDCFFLNAPQSKPALYVCRCHRLRRGKAFDSLLWSCTQRTAFVSGRDCVFLFDFVHQSGGCRFGLAFPWSKFKQMWLQVQAFGNRMYLAPGDAPPSTVTELRRLGADLVGGELSNLGAMIHNALAIEQGDYSIAQ